LDQSVGAIVGRQLDGSAAGHALRELEDVPHRGPAEAVQALVLVPDHAQVAALLRELQQELLLDIVSVLVLVHEHIAQVAGHTVRGAAIAQQIVHEPLQVREVGSVGIEKGTLVTTVGAADGH
jgi:hypothetical protein